VWFSQIIRAVSPHFRVASGSSLVSFSPFLHLLHKTAMTLDLVFYDVRVSPFPSLDGCSLADPVPPTSGAGLPFVRNDFLSRKTMADSLIITARSSLPSSPMTGAILVAVSSVREL